MLDPAQSHLQVPLGFWFRARYRCVWIMHFGVRTHADIKVLMLLQSGNLILLRRRHFRVGESFEVGVAQERTEAIFGPVQAGTQFFADLHDEESARDKVAWTNVAHLRENCLQQYVRKFCGPKTRKKKVFDRKCCV